MEAKGKKGKDKREKEKKGLTRRRGGRGESKKEGRQKNE
jgi:hypothetical protein